MTAKQRYDRLSSSRSQFLNAARQASELTLPYLIREDEHTTKGALKLTTPWQSTGAKGVVTLASKLMLALLPPQTSFFKLQVNDVNLPDELQPGTNLERRICILNHFHDSGGFRVGRLDDGTWFVIDDGDLVGFIAWRDDDVSFLSFRNMNGGSISLQVGAAHMFQPIEMILFIVV